ncbi:MAG: N-acetylglucosamine-6-phosphate deacetylase [Clostridia bacterium]|nr:N-acetylglucosamine-6-phosphate deacetylase [Clostridia bacterium]
MDKITFKNAKVIYDDRFAEGGITIEKGKIKSLETDYTCSNIVDCSGNYLSAGFIDMHLHGGGGSDFMDGTVKAYENIVSSHIKHGTTSFAPTVLGSSHEEIMTAINTYKQAKKLSHLNNKLLGIHLEGPYISKNQIGAQPEKHVRIPEPEEYEKIAETGGKDIIRWSVAPELEGMEKFSCYIKERGILLSIAHSDADYNQVVQAFKEGFSLITHLYSATSTIKRVNGFRVAGIIESAYLIDDMDVEIIADGCHLPESLLKLVCKFKNINRIALITDAMRAACQNVKKSFLGKEGTGVEVIIEDGVAKLKDKSSFGGSIATADRLIRTMINSDTGINLFQAVNMMTKNPARMLNIDNKIGAIKIGYDADIVVFDDNINIKKVYSKGVEQNM